MSWSNQTKDSSNWNNTTLDVSTFANQAKGFVSFDFLLLENGSYLLQESGFKLKLEQTATQTQWANLAE